MNKLGTLSPRDRLNNAGLHYDAAGNLYDLNDPDIEIIFTPFDQPIHLESPQRKAFNFYNFEGERLCEYDYIDYPDDHYVYILRDHLGQPLRRIELNGSNPWIWEKDYIRMPDRLLAAAVHEDNESLGRASSIEDIHFHIDHLGTPRLTTEELRYKVAREDYLPFGFQISTSGVNVTDERAKFTGHTRDFFAGPATKYDLDYMHARNYSPYLARFLSVDPVGGSVGSSQSWNRYSYVMNNPLKYLDPDGRKVTVSTAMRPTAAWIYKRSASFRSYYDSLNGDNRVRVTLRYPKGPNDIPTRARAVTRLPQRGGHQNPVKVEGNIVRVEAQVVLPHGTKAAKGQLAGHEFGHIIEWLEKNKTPSELLESGEGWTTNTDGHIETQAAIDAEQQVRQELASDSDDLSGEQMKKIQETDPNLNSN